MWTRKHSDESEDFDSSRPLDQTKKTNNIRVIYDSSGDDQEKEYEDFLLNIKQSSTPQIKKKGFLKTNFASKSLDIENENDLGNNSSTFVDHTNEPNLNSITSLLSYQSDNESENVNDLYNEKCYEKTDVYEDITDELFTIGRNSSATSRRKRKVSNDLSIEAENNIKPLPQSCNLGNLEYMPIEKVFQKLREPGDIIRDTITYGIKEHAFFVILDDENNERRADGKNGKYADDCGVWDSKKGRVVKSVFVKSEDNTLKSVVFRDHQHCSKKFLKGKTTYEKIEPQPSIENIVQFNRYYCTLKRCSTYKRRISRIDNSGVKLALMEYIGKYPEQSAPHGNAIHHDTGYTRTNLNVLEKIAELAKEKTPREIYKKMTLDDSFEAPKDFKQCQKVKSKQTKKLEIGSKTNLADEVLECISLVDSNDFVQQVCKVKRKMPNFICFTDVQKENLNFFLSQKSG